MLRAHLCCCKSNATLESVRAYRLAKKTLEARQLDGLPTLIRQGKIWGLLSNLDTPSHCLSARADRICAKPTSNRAMQLSIPSRQR